MKPLFLATLLIGLLQSVPTTANNTADFYKCVNKVGGEWNYGRAPNGCNANSFGQDQVILSAFPMTIFKDSASVTLERERYMEEIHAIARDAAKYYLKKRKSSVSATELNWFILGIMTTAAHESYASHYRRASDGKLKMMRGDVGHGHGMMQIDDRGHFDAINKGIAWNLITNLTYGMDIYYAAWERAPSKSCVGSATNYEARVRAAWSAYNGGPAQICRFANASSAHAAKDKAFLKMLRNKGWQNYVKNPLPVASIDVACLIEDFENCPAPGPGTPANHIVEGVLYKTPQGQHCAKFGGALHCVTEYRDAICLNALGDIATETVQLATQAAVNSLTKQMEDRHALCADYDSTLHKVGDFLLIEKNIFVRETPGGGKKGILLAGDQVEVLDFEVRDKGTNNRYYKIKMGALEGFIFAGSLNDHAAWTQKASDAVSRPSTIARAGDDIRITNAAGVNLRSTPDGNLINHVPLSTQLHVLEFVARGANNSIYYKVTYGSKTGFIYGGQLRPTDTTGLWVTRLRNF